MDRTPSRTEETMQQVVLKKSFVDRIGPDQLRTVLATIRIYAVLAMKSKVVVDTFRRQNLNNGEFIDLYSDLFATYHEGAKKFFQEYHTDILNVLSEPASPYETKMSQLFLTPNRESSSTYRILNHIRNHFSFHFGTTELLPLESDPIGIVKDDGTVTFISVTPNLFRFIATEIGKAVSQDNIQGFYRKVYNDEVRTFVKYLEQVVHRLVDENVDFIPIAPVEFRRKDIEHDS
jgi:hypothetical protein